MARIFLSPPDVVPSDTEAVLRAIDGGWIAPLGPEVDGFEVELAAATGRMHGAALSSGTGALHLALVDLGIGAGDRVAVPSLTFAASANAIRYTGAHPVFVDSERESWNIDPDLLAETLDHGVGSGRPISAVMTVDLYGQCADYGRIVDICAAHDVPLIEDAAEALGATRDGQEAGSFGVAAALSFNGNKIITTSGGGALVTDDADRAAHVRFLATQARDPAPHYQHSELGFNYRMSNLLAALGRSQLADLDRRVARRRDHRRFYGEVLGGLDGVVLMPEAPGCFSTFWLTALTIDPTIAACDREAVRLHLETLDIEARPVWKPMHLQPYYAGFEMTGGAVAEELFTNGLCLPSGSNLTDDERQMVAETVATLLA
jgi:pyridoxal phosphate-dependent aminotransferase EpsN